MPSFDIVCEVDMQEVKNALNQCLKEVGSRYDFKGSLAKIELDEKSNTLTVTAEDSMKLRALQEIMNQKLSKRSVGLKAFKWNEPDDASHGTLRQRVDIQQGIPTDEAREMVKMIKALGVKKLQVQIQDDQLRVTAPKKDDLQGVMQQIREKTKIEVQFKNFKD